MSTKTEPKNPLDIWVKEVDEDGKTVKKEMKLNRAKATIEKADAMGWTRKEK